MPAAPARHPRRRVDGVLLLDKPSGLSSNAALQRARRLFRAEKAGHTGTLDPLASGLLPLCFGEATKFAQALLDARKEYVATLRFGVATSTGDAEGETIASGPADVARDALEAALPRFTGRIAQVPPNHSALKHEGRAYYEYARAGVEIPRKPRDVDIVAIEIVGWSPPTATLRVECGKGTYIRMLAEDLGARSARAPTSRTPSDRQRPLPARGRGHAGHAGDARARRARRAAASGRCSPCHDAETRGRLGEAAALTQGRALPAATRAAGRYRAYHANRFVGIVATTTPLPVRCGWHGPTDVRAGRLVNTMKYIGNWQFLNRAKVCPGLGRATRAAEMQLFREPRPFSLAVANPRPCHERRVRSQRALQSVDFAAFFGL